MRVYLDPTTFTFTEDEWTAFAFIDRLDNLADALVKLREREAVARAENSAFRFRASDALMSYVYSLNPNVNEPERPIFYWNQFQGTILPELLRRTDFCPVEACSEGVGSNAAPPTAEADATDITKVFAGELALCASCGDPTARCFVTHADADRKLEANDFFLFTRVLPEDITALGNAEEVFPWEPSPKQEEKLHLALAIRRAQYEAVDPTWSDYSITALRASEKFWRTLRAADFGDESRKYRRRIIDVLTQISAGRDLDIQAHRMWAQTVKVDNVNLGKWNAYVFQMAASDQDRRCSRIYYARTSGGAYLDEYEPDAH